MNAQVGILIVDDERDFARGLARLLSRRFQDERVDVAFSAPEALERLREQPYAVLVTDMRMPAMGGLELLEQALSGWPHLSMVVLTAYGSIETAVQALKQGAYDFLTKPVEPEAMFRVVEKGLERSRLMGENKRLKELLASRDTSQQLIGESPAMRKLREAIAAVSGSDYTVLIRGESGTGKELAARTIHRLSRRAQKPLITVNCPAIPDQLLESELFGHVKGAFTGAEHDNQGLFLAAQGGSFLLDEIGDISQPVQTKLLRCLQEHEIRPVGSSKTIKINVRILASTNRNLEAKLEERSFREDLYYRLNVLTVHLPPLRERAEDIPLLVHHFLNVSSRELGVPVKEIAPEALTRLSAKPWPGNVRELLNFVRRLAVFAGGSRIETAHVRMVEEQTAGRADAPSDGRDLRPYKDAKLALLDDFTRDYTKRLLKATGGNISEAARVSGLTRVALQKICKRLELDAEQYR